MKRVVRPVNKGCSPGELVFKVTVRPMNKKSMTCSPRELVVPVLGASVVRPVNTLKVLPGGGRYFWWHTPMRHAFEAVSTASGPKRPVCSPILASKGRDAHNRASDRCTYTANGQTPQSAAVAGHSPRPRRALGTVSVAVLQILPDHARSSDLPARSRSAHCHVVAHDDYRGRSGRLPFAPPSPPLRRGFPEGFPEGFRQGFPRP